MAVDIIGQDAQVQEHVADSSAGGRTGRFAVHTREDGKRTPRGEIELLDLPGEVLSLICCYLDLPDLLPFLSLNPTLLSLTQSHLSPIRYSIATVLSQPPPYLYPPILAKLPLLSIYLPTNPIDAGRLFLPVLVGAPARWIVETLQPGRWPESIWKEAFERRFLPSWARYKYDDINGSGQNEGPRSKDTWRAAFMRVLGKLEHRNGGCTHEEAWTRFVTLHRNGSASLNRIYSRQFDPYEIFAELKRQNNFAEEPTTVRVVLHLADVRILAVGVLLDRPNMFVNRNAHEVLHPPALRDAREAREARSVQARDTKARRRAQGRVADRSKASEKQDAAGPTGSGQASRAHRASEPLIRTSATPAAVPSVSVTGQRGTLEEAPVAPNLTRSITINPTPTTDTAIAAASAHITETPKPRRSTLSALFGRAWSSSATSDTAPVAGGSGNTGLVSASAASPGWLGSMLTQVRSRDSGHRLDGDDNKHRRSFGRKNSGSSLTIPAAALFGEVGWGGLSSKSRRSSMSTGAAGGTRPEGAIQEAAETPVHVELGATPMAAHGAEEARSPALAMSGGENGVLSPHLQSMAGADRGELDVNACPTYNPEEDEADDVVSGAGGPQLDLVYPIMTHPQPARSHRYYPNITPFDTTPDGNVPENTLAGGGLVDAYTAVLSGPRVAESHLVDRRQLYDEVEDDYAGYLFSASEADHAQAAHLHAHQSKDEAEQEPEDQRRYVEWDEVSGRKRWVGPMLILAQLHPPSRPTAQPAHVSPSASTEGPDPDLGAKGTYISLGFEDIDALFPWLRLKGEGAYASSAKRGGMGFAAAGD